MKGGEAGLAVKTLTSYSEEKLNPLSHFEKFNKPGLIRPDDDYSSPLYMDFEDYNYIHDTSSLNHIYLNEFDFNLEEDRARIKELTRLEFSGNTFDPVAKCRCPDNPLRGNYLLNSNKVCGKCGSKVEMFLDKGHDTNLWLKTPEGVDKFISIAIYNTFFTSLVIGTPSIIVPRYFMDSTYRGQFTKKVTAASQVMSRLKEELSIKEFSLNTFVEKADDIVLWLTQGNGRRNLRKPKDGDKLYTFWLRYRSSAFSDYLKVPKNYATVLQMPTRKEVYSYKHQPDTAKLYFSIADTYKSNEVHKLTERELKKNLDIVGRNLVALAEQYGKQNNRLTMFAKKSLFRKHVCSGELPFTGRSVISSQTGIIDTNVLIVPWKMVITMLEPHIHSYLYRKGFTPTKVKNLLSRAAHKVVPILNDFFREVEESNKCLVQAGRNPSIEYLSLRTFFLSVNRDLEDESIKLPILAVKEMNADFDGRL